MFSANNVLQLLAAAAVSAAAGSHAPLHVQLSPFNGTTITAVITNPGDQGYNLLHRNSVLDVDPSRKLRLSGHAHGKAHFRGLHKHQCKHAGHETPSANDFTKIAAGQTLYRDIDIAEMYDLDNDMYDIFAEGALPYAADDSLWLSGNTLLFSSNVLELPITSAQVVDQADVKRKRTTIQSDCSSEQSAVIMAANEGCVSLANGAADAATSGPAEMIEKYFKDSSDSTRSKVAEIFKAVSKECAATPGGTSESYCTDPRNFCSGNLVAYTYWTTGGYEEVRNVYYCPRYFDNMPSDSTRCHSQSQASNVLHEMTHALAETDDHAYGFDACMALSAEQAIDNADTFALFATDVDQGCAGGKPSGRPDDSSYGGTPSYSPKGEGTSNNGWEQVQVTTTVQASPPTQTNVPTEKNSPATETPSEAPEEPSNDSTSQPESSGNAYTWADLMQWFSNYQSRQGQHSEQNQQSHQSHRSQWSQRWGSSAGGWWRGHSMEVS